MFWFILSLILIYVLILILRNREEQANRELVLSVFRRYVQQVLVWSRIGVNNIESADPSNAAMAANIAKGYLMALKDYMRAYNIYPDNVKVLIGIDLSELEKTINRLNKV
jgi:hypothetical protein